MAFFVAETGVSKENLTCSVEDGDVTLRATRWLENGWAQVMDYVDAFDGEWISDKKNSHWLFPLERIQDRFEAEA